MSVMLSYTTVIALGNGNELFVIDIEAIGSDLKALIDEKFVKICEGNSGTDLSLVKQRLVDFLTSKKGSQLEIGSIAEFFLHLFLNEAGFVPQFLYLNLEEGSIKKGFDGYYYRDNAEWIMESKSGSSTTQGISHKSKIKEAYSDLSAKFSSDVTNNPWQNAYNHASHIDVASLPNVRASIKQFSEGFLKGKAYNIRDFNIIPGSTIVLDGTWVNTDVAGLETDMKALIADLQFTQIKVLCITKKSLLLFWDYLTNP